MGQNKEFRVQTTNVAFLVREWSKSMQMQVGNFKLSIPMERPEV